MKGDLQEISLIDLVQVTCRDKIQARLTVHGDDGVAAIFFYDGDIVHAELGPLRGKEALFKALRREHGSFELEKNVTAPERTLTAGSMELLLESMESIDASSAAATSSAAGGEKDAVEADLRRKLESSGVDLYEERAGQNLARRLRRVPGVVGALLVARDGTVLADDLAAGTDADQEAAVAVLVGNAAGEIAEALALGGLDRGAVEVGGERLLVLEQSKYFVGLILEDRASPELVHGQAAKLLG